MGTESTRWEHAREILAHQGIGGIVEEVGARLRHRVSDPAGKVPYHEFRTEDWDRGRGVQTTGNVWLDAYTTGLNNLEHAGAYLPTTIWGFRQLMAALGRAGVRPREFTMVDYGCGKGRAVLLGVEAGFR